MSIGGRISLLRQARGMTSAELARRVGIKPPSLWQIEHGDTKSLRADTLMRLASALDTNPYYLWTGRGNPATFLDPNVEEAEVVDLFRRLTASNQAASLSIIRALLLAQTPGAPSKSDPFPTASPAKSKK